VTVGILGTSIAPRDPFQQDLFRRLKPPSAANILGTDELGRDVLSRLILGARVTVAICLISVTTSLVAGTALGLVAGYFGGVVDVLITRGIDVLLAFPGMLSAILLVAILGPGLTSVIIAAAIFSTPSLARIVRSSVISLKEREFVEGASALGASSSRIIIRHLLPNSLAPIIVVSTTNVGVVIIIAASLSFLGLGVQPPNTEWGAMVASGRDYLRVAPHVTTIPGLALLAVVLGFNLLGDGLRDALDPNQSPNQLGIGQGS